MTSTKLAVSLICLASAGIGTGIALGITWFYANQSSDHGAQVSSELLRIWITALSVTAAVMVLPVWIFWRRVNRSVQQLASALAERRVSSAEFPVIVSLNRDPEYQKLVAEVNCLIGVLKESQTRLDQYAAKVAHELRGPLTLLQLQLDCETKQLDPQFLDVMTAQIRRLTEYVDTALYLAKVADNKIRPFKTRQKIAGSVQEIVASYKLQAAAQQRQLSIDLSIEPEAELDQKIFGLILHNLLTNAMTHGLGEIRLRSRAGNGAVALVILNRVRATGNTEIGTGIGLRTVESLTQAHNLQFRIRRVFNCYVATLRIPILAPDGALTPQKIKADRLVQ
jgi:two-component system OmpR family sensor kinase